MDKIRNEQENALTELLELQPKMKQQKADVTGLTYVQLYGILQQLYMQGENTAVAKICSELNLLLG